MAETTDALQERGERKARRPVRRQKSERLVPLFQFIVGEEIELLEPDGASDSSLHRKFRRDFQGLLTGPEIIPGDARNLGEAQRHALAASHSRYCRVRVMSDSASP